MPYFTRRATLVGSLAATGLLGARSASARAQDDRLTHAMDKLLAPWVSADKPGLAVTVLVDGKTAYAKGAGLADLEQSTPIAPDTPFHAASLAKQFTAYAALLLVESGQLSLDDRVERHLPEMEGPGRTLTMHHLLHHTSGLRDQDSLVAAAGWRDDDALDSEQLRRLVFRQTGLNFQPGNRFQYNNTGYFLLAQIVARIAGQRMPEFCRERIFAPLGMTRTQFCDDNTLLIPGRAYSYIPRDSGFQKGILSEAVVGPSCLVTTSQDLCRWAQAFETPAARSGALAAMAQRSRLNDGRLHFYAMGQEFHEHEGRQTWSHGGRHNGFRSFLLRIPSERFCVAVLGNTPRLDAAKLAYAAADIYLPRKAERRNAAEAVGAGPRETSLGRYVGNYELFPGQIIVVTANGAKLNAGWMGSARTVPLEPIKPGVFMFDPASNISLEFDDQGVGLPRGLTYRVSLSGVLEAPRVDLAPFDGRSVAPGDYVGRYRCRDLEAEYDIIANGDDLIARHFRLADIPLRAYQPDQFRSPKAFFGRVKFERDSRGRVKGMIVSGAVAEGLLFYRLTE